MKLFLPTTLLLMVSVAAPAAAGDVQLQLGNGRITLQARDATVREILAEWARVGGVRIVNGERVMGAPLTLDLQGVPEAQALNVLLRSVSGYMAAPKTQAAASASMYDRIVIMAAPRSAAVSAGAAMPMPQQPMQFQQRGMVGMNPANPAMLDDQDEPTGPPPMYPGAYPRGTLPPQQPFAQPPGMPQQVPAPGSIPQGAPGTVSPYVVQPGQPVTGGPPQPGAVVQPATGAPGAVSPPQQIKKPGGPGGPGLEDR